MGKITITTGITGDSLVSSLNDMNDELYGGLIVQTKGGGHYAIPESGVTPVGLGVGALDLQATRGNDYQTAKSTGSFIAGGGSNEISDILVRDSLSYYSHVENLSNKAHDWFGHAEGTGSMVDGKISHVEGNACICSANDAHAEGNRSVCGRKYFSGVTSGSEDAGDGLGVMQFVIIPNSEGDVSAYFPNALLDSAYILTHYGVGAQKDVKGNIYSSSHVPAIWTGELPTTVNDLKWALHRIFILRGQNEPDFAFATIAKTVYTEGFGTKIHYYGAKPYSILIGVYSSYAPTVSIDGLQGGNGGHAEGVFTTTYGYSTHAEGNLTRAWAAYAHSEGNQSKATGESSHAEGVLSAASGYASHAEGNQNLASGNSSHAEGFTTKATSTGAHAEGYKSEASGGYSHAEGGQTKATGANSHAEGIASEATNTAAHAEGNAAKATGLHSHAENKSTTASGENSHAEGLSTVANGLNSHAEGNTTEAAGENSHAGNDRTKANGKNSVAINSLNVATGENSIASGLESVSLRKNQQSYSSGKRVAAGDDQTTTINYSFACAGVGWFEIYILNEVEDGKVYHFDTMVLGTQYAGTAGVIGDSFAYRFSGIFIRNGETYTTIGTPTRTLIGRSAGMTGDGLSTGARMSYYGRLAGQHRVDLRFDGVTDTTFRVQAHSTIQELKYN